MITKLTAAQQAVLKEIDGGKELKFCWATKLYHYKSPQFCFTGPKTVCCFLAILMQRFSWKRACREWRDMW